MPVFLRISKSSFELSLSLKFTALSSTSKVPLCGSQVNFMHLRSVDLPQPDEPTITVVCPSLKLVFMLSSTK